VVKTWLVKTVFEGTGVGTAGVGWVGFGWCFVCCEACIEGCDGRDLRVAFVAMAGVEDESEIVDAAESAGQQQHTNNEVGEGEGGEGGEGGEEEGEEEWQGDVVVANIEEAGDTWEEGKDIRGVPKSVLEVSLCLYLSSSPPPSLLLSHPPSHPASLLRSDPETDRPCWAA
jgi:hypothetical protein